MYYDKKAMIPKKKCREEIIKPGRCRGQHTGMKPTDCELVAK